ncbi:MAG: nickel-responsive transcriptional regulator NikR [Elusimicrobia bacterium]|nr:nickel-responsive transcriptional regulator NikR [Elusimicrobiota bacterium]
MAKIKRFGVSLNDEVLKDFDSLIKRKGYPTRSKAIEDIIREELKKESLVSGNKGTGAIMLVYDHHKRELVAKLTDIQHDYHDLVICNQHIHLDHHNCMEVIVIKGNQRQMQELSDELGAQKGVKSATLTIASSE